MKKSIIFWTITGISFLLISCSGGRDGELAKLKKQREVLDGKIRELETGKVPAGKETPDPLKFRFVGITQVISGTFDHYIRVQGKLDGDQNAAVYADVMGTITRKYADAGQRVSRGQVLAQVDDGQFRKQLEGLESQFKFANDLYEKQKRLWDQKIGSEVQYLQSKTNKESVEQQLASMKDQLDKFRIKSPIDGTIEECNIRVGSVVSPDPRLPAYRVMAFRGLKVSAEVSEAYAARVKVGDKLIVSFPDIDRKIDSRVGFVSRYINPVNRTFIVESPVGEQFPEMKANMVVILLINDYHNENSIRIPINVIQTDQSGSYVYVIRKQDQFETAVKLPVTIGNTYNGVAEITGGLTIGDKVVTAGFQELADNENVRYDTTAGSEMVNP